MFRQQANLALEALCVDLVRQQRIGLRQHPMIG
jgi:hypothetical protein